MSYSPVPPAAPSSSPSAQTQSHKRKQVKNACTHCASKKLRCDEQRPCLRCQRFQVDCVDSERKPRLNGGKRSQSDMKASRSSSSFEKKSSRSGGDPNTSYMTTPEARVAQRPGMDVPFDYTHGYPLPIQPVPHPPSHASFISYFDQPSAMPYYPRR